MLPQAPLPTAPAVHRPSWASVLERHPTPSLRPDVLAGRRPRINRTAVAARTTPPAASHSEVLGAGRPVYVGTIKPLEFWLAVIGSLFFHLWLQHECA
jgi:hypothetical protein